MPSSRRLQGWLFVLPVIIFLGFMICYPMVSLFGLSVFHYDLIYRSIRFVGLRNYVRILSDPEFIYSLEFTVIFAVTALALEGGVGLILAVLFNMIEFKGKRALITFIFTPVALAPVVIGYMARMIFNAQNGYITYPLSIILGKTIEWFSDPLLAFLVLLLADFWQWMPFIFVCDYAALQSVPLEPIESAMLEGASYWQIIRRISLPYAGGIIFAVLLLRGLDALKVFDYIVITTHGGPGYYTQSLSMYLYKYIFTYGDIGYASAAAVFFLILVSIVMMIYFKLTGRMLVGGG